VEGVVIHREVLWRHKRSLQTLEWTCARLDWYLADDSSEELALDDQPMLWSLRHVCVQSSSFSRSCFHRGERFSDRTLLNAIYAYITPGFTDDAAGYHASRVEHTWHLYMWQDRYWLWNSNSGECFFVHKPPNSWRRYYWFAFFPRSPSAVVTWWHNAAHRRWFLEPCVPEVQQMVYAAHSDPMNMCVYAAAK